MASFDPEMLKKNFSFLREKLLHIHDTPHKIALGFGLGIFAGVLPGTGPLAALFLAALFRANAAAALAGSVLVNTWISFAILTVSLQVGAWVTGSDWQVLYQQAQALMRDFHWQTVFSDSMWGVVKPLGIGYLTVSLFLGFATYLLTLGLVWQCRRARGP